MFGRLMLAKMVSVEPTQIEAEFSKELRLAGTLQVSIPRDAILDETLREVLKGLKQKELIDKVGQYYVNVMAKYVIFHNIHRIIDFGLKVPAEGLKHVNASHEDALNFNIRFEEDKAIFWGSLFHWLGAIQEVFWNADLEYVD